MSGGWSRSGGRSRASRAPTSVPSRSSLALLFVSPVVYIILLGLLFATLPACYCLVCCCFSCFTEFQDWGVFSEFSCFLWCSMLRREHLRRGSGSGSQSWLIHLEVCTLLDLGATYHQIFFETWRWLVWRWKYSTIHTMCSSHLYQTVEQCWCPEWNDTIFSIVDKSFVYYRVYSRV